MELQNAVCSWMMSINAKQFYYNVLIFFQFSYFSHFQGENVPNDSQFLL